jgi:hypothetical protein
MSIDKLKKHGITLNKLKQEIDKSIKEKKYYTNPSHKNSVFLPLTFDGSDFVLEQKFVANKKESLEDVLKKTLKNISSWRETNNPQDSLDVITQAFASAIEDQKTFQLFETSLQPSVGDSIVFDDILLSETNPQLRSLYTVLIQGRDVIPLEDIGKVRGHVRSDSVESLLIGTEGEVLSDTESGDANLPIASVADHIASLKKYLIDYSEQAGIPFLAENTIYNDLNSIDKTCIFINKTSPILNQPVASGLGVVFNYVEPDLNIILQIFVQISSDPSIRKIYYRQKFTDWGVWINLATGLELQTIATNVTTLQAELNTAKQTIQVLTERTKNFHKTNLVETHTGEEILVNVDGTVFTDTNNVCKYPSPTNKPLERWICYVNEEVDNTLWIKNIDTDGWGNQINFIPSSCPRMLSETEIIYIEKTTNRIRRKKINIPGNGDLIGPPTVTAKYIAPAFSRSILFSQKGTVSGALDGDLMLFTSQGSVVKILNLAKASYVYYRRGFFYYVNNNLNNFQAYRKAHGTAETNDAGTKMTGFADSSPDEVANIFSVGDNMLCFSSVGGFMYLKRDNEPNCIAAPIGIPAGRKLYGGCDLGGGEIIFFKETFVAAGEFSMYRKKIFEYI